MGKYISMKNFSTNLAELFHERVSLSGRKTALLKKSRGAWHSITWEEYQQQVFEVALSLKKAGVGPGDRVAILSQSRTEWLISDLAILSIGAVTVPIYPSLLVEDVFHIVSESEAKVLFIEDNVQKEKLIQLRNRLPLLQQVVSFSQVTEEDILLLETWVDETKSKVTDLDQEKNAWVKSAKNIKPLDLASIVYTSGTSGKAKGVCLSHLNFLSVLENAQPLLGLGETDMSLNYLPLSHVLGRVEALVPLSCGSAIAFSTSLARLTDELSEIKPTLFFTVPRFFDRIYQALLSELEKGHAIKGMLSKEFMKLCLQLALKLESRKNLGPFLNGFQLLADKFIFEKIRQKLGGRLRYSICGGAPLAADVSRFFYAAGVLILEGYGLTESTGPVTLNRPHDFRFGTVGKPLKSCELAIREDGEIEIRGRMVSGLYLKPGEKPVLHEMNTLLTGDIGVIDSDGFLKITDRKKDIIVLAGGKNVAPQKIEGLFKQDPIFSNAIILGDNQKHVSALLTLNIGELKKVAAGIGFESSKPLGESLQDKSLQDFIRKRVGVINKQLANFESVRAYKVLPRDLSLEAGELTPSLKVKRKYCIEKYKSEIQSLFEQ